MKRRLLNLVTALSVLLCVAAGVMWVRSYWRSDSIRWDRNTWGDTNAESILVESVTADFEGGTAILRWWRYESYEWTGHIDPAGFHTASGPSRRYRSGFSREQSIGCWLHRSIAGVELHFADDRKPRGLAHHWYHVWLVSVPLWMVCAVAAVVSGCGGLAWFRSRRCRRGGLCVHCGYDLRATPGKCPECGVAPTPPDISQSAPRPGGPPAPDEYPVPATPRL